MRSQKRHIEASITAGAVSSSKLGSPRSRTVTTLPSNSSPSRPQVNFPPRPPVRRDRRSAVVGNRPRARATPHPFAPRTRLVPTPGMARAPRGLALLGTRAWQPCEPFLVVVPLLRFSSLARTLFRSAERGTGSCIFDGCGIACAFVFSVLQKARAGSGCCGPLDAPAARPHPEVQSKSRPTTRVPRTQCLQSRAACRRRSSSARS